MFAIETGPLWPTSTKPDEDRARCLLRLPRWFALPPDVNPADVRIEQQGGELVLVVVKTPR